MKKPKFKPNRIHEAAFDKAIKATLKRKGQQVGLDGMLPNLSTSEDEIREARECYLAHTDLVEATVDAVSKALKSPEFSSRIKYFGKNMTAGELQDEGRELIRDLVATGDFDPVFGLAGLVGVKALGIGVAGSFQLLLVGAEKGYEGLWILPQDAYGIVNPNQFTTRNWGEVTAGVDLLASAGINLSFWFKEPEMSLITGVFADLVLPVGLRFSYIKTFPKPEEKPTPPFHKPDATFAGFSLRVSLGLEIGGGVFLGYQKVPADAHKHIDKPILPSQDLMTLNLENPATGASNVQIGVAATLDAILLPPSGGTNDPCILTTNETTLTLTIPDFLSESVPDMVVTLNGWRQDASTGGTLNLTYIGTNGTAWADNLVFTISGAKNNADITAPISSTVRVLVSNDDTTWRTSTPLSLVNLVFSANLATWALQLGSSCTLASPPEGYPDSTLPRTGSNVTVNCPNDNAGWTQLTQFIDSSGRKDTTWNVGVYFFQSGTEPMMQAVIWEDGTSWANGTKYSGMPAKQLSTAVQDLPPAYYQSQESTMLTISNVKLNS